MPVDMHAAQPSKRTNGPSSIVISLPSGPKIWTLFGSQSSIPALARLCHVLLSAPLLLVSRDHSVVHGCVRVSSWPGTIDLFATALLTDNAVGVQRVKSPSSGSRALAVGNATVDARVDSPVGREGSTVLLSANVGGRVKVIVARVLISTAFVCLCRVTGPRTRARETTRVAVQGQDKGTHTVARKLVPVKRTSWAWARPARARIEVAAKSMFAICLFLFGGLFEVEGVPCGGEDAREWWPTSVRR